MEKTYSRMLTTYEVQHSTYLNIHQGKCVGDSAIYDGYDGTMTHLGLCAAGGYPLDRRCPHARVPDSHEVLCTILCNMGQCIGCLASFRNTIIARPFCY